MNAHESLFMLSGILVGFRKAKELFRASTDAKGGCKMLSQGSECKCFLCLVDNEITKAETVVKGTDAK
jgi:hypothetical protein